MTVRQYKLLFPIWTIGYLIAVCYWQYLKEVMIWQKKNVSN